MRTLPVILLSLLVAFPLLADIPVAAPTLRPATGAQTFPVLASNGTDALAAWQDERALPQLPSATPTVPEREIYAARIAPDGTPSLDFDVTPSVETDVAPGAVWNGDEFIVAHLMAQRFGFDGGIRFTRVKPDDAGDNRLIPRAEYPAAPQFGLFSTLSLAWNGDEYLVVMSSQFPLDSGSIWGLLVDRSFHPIGDAFLIATGQTSQASAASDGHAFFVTWVDARRIGVATVSPSGAVAAQPFLSETPTGGFFTSAPAVVWNGQRYLVTWTDPVVRARFVEREGTASSPVLDLFGAGRDTAVAWNGSQYLVPFQTEGDRNDIYALRLDGEGKVLGEPFPIAASDASQSSPTAVAIGNRFVVAWTDADSIRSTVVDGDVLQPQSVVARSLGLQDNPSGLFDGTNLVFTWSEEGKVYLGRVTLDGQPLDGGGIPLGEGGGSMLAFNGQQYAVSFILKGQDQSRVVRIDRDGKVLGATDVGARVADISTDGRDFLLLSVLTPQPARIRPVILTAQGELLPQPVINDLPFDSTNPAAAWIGSHYAVVYTQSLELFCFKCNHQKYELHTVLLDRAGAVASPIRTITAGQAPFAYQIARIASGGGSTIAVIGGGSGAIVARIAQDGVPAVTAELPDFFYPTGIIWTGADFVAAPAIGDSALRLSSDGTLLLRFPIVGSSLVAGAPRLTVVYARAARIDGQGTIVRAFFDFVQEHRRRAR